MAATAAAAPPAAPQGVSGEAAVDGEVALVNAAELWEGILDLLRSEIGHFGVWAAPSAPETFPKGWGLRPPPFPAIQSAATLSGKSSFIRLVRTGVLGPRTSDRDSSDQDVCVLVCMRCNLRMIRTFSRVATSAPGLSRDRS